MTFLAPLWLLALASLPVLIVLYLIRSRYRIEHVASVLLWRGAPRDLVAHTSWRRPRWELLLIVQLLAALAAALALARPAFSTPPARSLVIVLDVSASMRARDVLPTRFDAARGQVASLAREPGAGDWLALVVAGSRPRIAAQGPPGAIVDALGDLAAEDGASDMAAALRMATGLASARPHASGHVVVVTDGAFALDNGLPPQAAAVSFRLVGGQSENVAVSQVTLRRPLLDGRPVAGFASAVNFSSAPITSQIVIYADDIQVDSRQITVPARTRAEVSFEVPNGTQRVVVALPVRDVLPEDNSVEVDAPAKSARGVVVISDDPTLWGRVLDAVPYVHWRAVKTADYDEHQLGSESLVLFDGFLPPQLPQTALILVGSGGPFVTASGAPRPARASDLDPEDPLLRGLDLSPLSVTGLTPIVPPDWASIDIADAAGTPLLLHGSIDGRRVVLLPFELSASNLPQLAAFPLLVTNVIDWLTPNRAEVMHAGPAGKADIAPRPESVAIEPPQGTAQTQPAAQTGWFEVWPLLVVLLVGLLIAEWLIAVRWRFSSPLRASGLAMMLRLVVLACATVPLLRPAMAAPDDASTVVFALDTSSSISPENRHIASTWLGSALDARRANDRAGLVALATDPHVVRAPGPEPLPSYAADDGQVTDLALGLRVAAGLARGERGRVVLLSDGQAISGGLNSALAEVGDVPIDVVSIGALPSGPRIALQTLELPAYVRAGETFDGTAMIGASQSTTAIVQIDVDGQPGRQEVVQLAAGINRIGISQTLSETGFHRISARVGGPAGVDTTPNSTSTFVVVKAPPRVLLIEERRGEGASVQTALRGAGVQADLLGADQLPAAAQLQEYAAVMLANVSATSLTLDQQKLLRTFVETSGHGLVVLGGSTSYGLGSYADSVLEQALPVTSTVPPKPDAARMALLLIIDNSQSMSRKSDGVSSMQMAQQAAVLAARSLDDRDQIGVLSFNNRFEWLLEMGVVGQYSRATIEERIARLEPQGGTEIFAALSEGARAMLATRADLRHIILFTDGQSGPANYEQLTAGLRQEKIGLSTIGLGPEADTQLLASLAKLGEGRYYFTERTPELPRIMAREVNISKRSAQIEGTIRPQLVSPSPVLRGVAPSDLPPLAGYVATNARDEAQVVLATEDRRPLLAQWHFGLGRAVSWTSDTSGPWAAAWLEWPGAARIWEQAARWSMGPPVETDFQVTAQTIGQHTEITLDSVRGSQFADQEAPTAEVSGPTGVAATVPLRQVAPGRYAATVTADVAGVYQVTVTTHPQAQQATSRSETTGFVVRTDAQQASFGTDDHVLRRIASETGGRMLTAPADAFRSSRVASGVRWEPVWQQVLLAGLVLFVLDVAQRRLAISAQAMLARLSLSLRKP